MSQLFVIIGNLLMVAVLVTYFKQVKEGTSIPNPSTWLLWVVVSLMNAVSYFLVVQENLWQSMYVLVATTGLTVIFIYSVMKGKFGKIGTMEKISFVLALAVGILWKTTGSADLANLSLQVIFVISFIPTIHGLLTHKLKEKGLPWNLAVASYAFITAGILTSESYRWIALVYPIVNGILGNGSVALIVALQERGFFAEASDETAE